MNRTKLALLLPGSLLALALAGACASAGSPAAPTATGRGSAAVAPAPTQQPATKPEAGQAIPDLTVPEGPRVQRNGRIALQVADGRFDATLNDVIAIVDQAGGYIAGSDAQAADQGTG